MVYEPTIHPFLPQISGHSIEMWLDHIDDFKQGIFDRLAQPAHQIEREYFYDIGHPDRAQFVVHCPAEFWRVFGFLDDTTSGLVSQVPDH